MRSTRRSSRRRISVPRYSSVVIASRQREVVSSLIDGNPVL
jgi:hypothetical protein